MNEIDFGETGGTTGVSERAPRTSWPVRGFTRTVGVLGSRAAFLAGAYAWLMTVLPVAYAAPGFVPMAFAVFALVVHFAITATGLQLHDLPDRVWATGTYGFLGLCLAVWLLVPADVLLREMNTARGVSGMLGFSVYVLASEGAPPIARPLTSPAAPKTPLRARFASASTRAEIVLLAAALLAFAVQFFAWGPNPPELATLYRLLLLAASLAILSSAGPLALRVAARKPARWREKPPPIFPPLRKRR